MVEAASLFIEWLNRRVTVRENNYGPWFIAG